MTNGSLTDRLLVATPGLTDPTFSRTVILLLAHGDEGALGVVLNRPGALPAVEVAPAWSQLIAPPEVVFIGGPVEPSTGICLGATADGWLPLDLESDPATADVRSVRLFAAHSGWSAGQLDAEIQAGGWYVLTPRPSDPFSATPQTLWRDVLRRQGGRVALASTSTDDPSLN